MADTPQELPANGENPFDTADALRKRGFRWKTGLLLLIVAIAVVAGVYNYTEDRTAQVIRLYLAIAGSGLVLLAWWMFFSGVRWKTKFIGLGVVLLGLAGARASVRLEGWTGDFFPNFAFRWSPTAEERANKYFDKADVDHQSSTVERVDGFYQAEMLEPSEPFEIAEDDFPAFRGADRSGIVTGQTIRTDWDSHPPTEVWKHPAGPAWSGITVVGDYVFTQEQRENKEVTVCYDFKTGKQVWLAEDEDRYADTMGGIGPRATPVVYDSRLYTLGAMGVLNCFEPKTGRRLWSRNILTDANSSNAHWGMAGSPLLFDNMVVVSPGDRSGPAVVAYDRKTGEKLWEAGTGPAGYAAPRLETLEGQRQILVFGNAKLGGYDIEKHEMLWSFPWPNDMGHNCTQPIKLDNGNVVISTGYGKGAALIDVSREGDSWNAEAVDWKLSKRFKLKFNDAVHQEAYLYGSNDGILTSFDTGTGKVAWKKERVGYGQLLMVGDHLLVLSENGDLFLVRTHPRKYQKEGKVHVLEGKCWNHLALARGFLFIRSDAEIACYDLRPATTTTASVGE